MPARARPLSPHLDVYRWQISNTLSILHRLTGVGLSVGLLALAYWFVALSQGEASYETALHLFHAPLGLICLFGWSFAFFYHFLNGIRHLFWDVGMGFERPQRHTSGWAVVCGSIVVTLGVWSALWLGGRL